MFKTGSDSSPLTIECSYCGSAFDYREHRTCPSCAAVPSKEQIDAAYVRANENVIKSKTEKADTKYTGKFMRKLIKLIPVWIVFIFVIIWIPEIKQASDEKKIVNSLKSIENPEYIEHKMGENFLYDKFFNVVVDEFIIADSDAANALMPSGYKLLAIHITAVSDGSGASNDYHSVEPYIAIGGVCREPISSSSLRSMPDVFANNPFYFSSSKYNPIKDGYICFIAEENTASVDLCFEETHMENKVRQLDCIHKINIDLSEEWA